MNSTYDTDPQNAPYIKCAECGAEVYENGKLYTWERQLKKPIDNKFFTEEVLICGECLLEHLREVSITQAAELLGSNELIVGKDVGCK